MRQSKICNDYVMVTSKGNFTYRMRRQLQCAAYVLLGAKSISKIYYRISMGRPLHLANPQTFTEKITWYKLFYCPENERIIQCSDKYAVRSFLENLNLGNYLSELVGVWDTPEEIDWDALPDKFALKDSNGCGHNIICRDKSHLDKGRAKALLRQWQRTRFGRYYAEPHYDIGEKRILCEKYIESAHFLPVDYKIHCMNGDPKVLQVCQDRNVTTKRFVYYDVEGHPLNFGKYPQKRDLEIEPELLVDMVRICRIIAPHFPYVRIDFFVNQGKLQIGELTFTPSAGLKPDLNYGDGDRKMGEMLDISGLLAGNG